MPRGGHSKSGPIAQGEEARRLHGSRTRANHREKGAIGVAMVVCSPPPGLSKGEQAFWNYYAPQLVAERRLTMKSRDTLAKYCTALAVVSGLRRQLSSRKRTDIEERSDTRKELRQWLLASRLYENDLLLNPASAVRAPKADVAPPIEPDAPDTFGDFDEAADVH